MDVEQIEKGEAPKAPRTTPKETNYFKPKNSTGCEDSTREKPFLLDNALDNAVRQRVSEIKERDSRPDDSQASSYEETSKESPFPIDALLPKIKDAVVELAKAIQVPVPVVANSVLSVACLAVQPHVDVRLISGKVAPTGNFFLTIVESGGRKTTVDECVLKPVRARESELIEDYASEKKEYDDNMKIYESHRKKIIGGKGDPKNAKEMREMLKKDGIEKPECPIYPRLILSDATTEATVKQAAEGNPSFGLFSDEAAVQLGGYSMKQKNKMHAFGVFNKLWGATPFNKSRILEGDCRIEGTRVSAHLMGQPEAIKPLLRDEVAKGTGFLARCLMVWPKSLQGERLFTEEHSKLLNRMYDTDEFCSVIRLILEKDLPIKEGTRNVLEPQVLEFYDDARQVMIEFYNEVESKLGKGGEYEPIAEFANKALEHATRLAAALEAFERHASLGTGEVKVSLKNVERACEIMRWYLHHWFHVLDQLHKTGQDVAKEKICKQIANKGERTTNEILRSQVCPGMKTKDINVLLGELVKEGKIEEVSGQPVRYDSHRKWRSRG